jgi:hypothetical protein
MRILICGSRHYTDSQRIKLLIDTLDEHAVVIHGAAPGADRIADELAKAHGLDVEPYPAKWSKYGRAAGPIRNTQMLEVGRPDEVHAFHDNLGESRGTTNMITQALQAGVHTVLHHSEGSRILSCHTRE